MADFDYRQSIEKDTLEQFRGQPNIQVLHDVFAKQLQDVYDFFMQLKLHRWIHDASGKQLDGIGDIVCLSREECAKYAGMFRSGCIGDEEYRVLLKSKIIINTNDATYYGIIRSIRSLYGAYPIYYTEDPSFPATIIFELDAAAGGNIAPLGFVPPVKAAGVGILWQYTIRAIVEVSMKVEAYQYRMPPCNTLYCGTFPSRATLGWTVLVEVRCPSRLDVLKYLPRLCGTYPIRATLGAMPRAVIDAGTVVRFIQNDGKLCGVNPSEATGGWSISGNINTPASINSQTMTPPFSGTDECGTAPFRPSAAWSIAAAVISQPDALMTPETPPFCNGIDCGTHPNPPTLGLVTGGGADTSASVILAKNTPTRSGMADCGTTPNKVTAGGTAESEVGTSGDVTVVPFAVPHADARCGTLPESMGIAAERGSAADISCSTEGYQVSAPFCNTKRCGQ